MKILSIVIALVFSLNTSAAALSRTAQLENIIDSYQFAIEVEWDQKDQSFYDKKTNEYVAALSAFVEDGQISESDFTNLMAKKGLGKSNLDLIRTKIALKGEMREASQVEAVMNELRAEMYKEGASWVGGLEAGEVLFWGAILAITLHALTEKCVEESSEQIMVCQNSGSSSVCEWRNKCVRFSSIFAKNYKY